MNINEAINQKQIQIKWRYFLEWYGTGQTKIVYATV